MSTTETDEVCFYAENLAEGEIHTCEGYIDGYEVQIHTLEPNYRFQTEGYADSLRERGYPEEDIERMRKVIVTTNVVRTACHGSTSSCHACGDLYLQPHARLDDVTGRAMNVWSDPRSYYPNYEDLCRSCSSTTVRCERCDAYTDVDESAWVDGDTWCDSCLSNDSYYCDDCGEHSRWECTDHNGSGRFVHDYSYKPDPIFQTSGGEIVSYRRERMGTIFMGFELEVETNGNSDGAEYMYDESDSERLWYLKHDGSLTNGFEIVSHPMTLERYHELDLSWTEELTNTGHTSWTSGTCGIHVHISRDAFKNASHIYKFAHFIASHRAEMTRLAGRDSERWARFDGTGEKIIRYVKGQEYPQRYEAVNFCNHNTLELRFFRGSLRKERLLSALELTHAVATYTGIINSNDAIQGALKWNAFASWVTELNSETYPNLIHYITKFSL